MYHVSMYRNIDKDAYYKSFRIIAPHHLEEHLLSSDVWPVGIWMKEFDLNINALKEIQDGAKALFL